MRRLGLWIALVGAALVAAKVLILQVPPVVAISAYSVVGWSVGAGFNRANLLGAARALPAITAAVILLVVACAGTGLLSSWALGLDPLTGSCQANCLHP